LHKETLAPEELLEELKIHANSRKRRSLEIIAEICSEQRERNSKDFFDRDHWEAFNQGRGAATQSIRNKNRWRLPSPDQGVADHTGGSTKKSPTRVQPTWEAILDKIDDPVVRSIMGSILISAQVMQRETCEEA